MGSVKLITAPNISPAEKISQALAILGKEKRSVREMRSLIMGFEATIQQMAGAMTAKDFDTRHHFAPGIYMRELHIPAGTVLTGKIHSTEHLNILSQGEITVWTEDGMKRLSASTTVKSKPGIKRVGWAHTDCVWITVHHNPDNADLATCEARLFHDDFNAAYLASDRSFETALSFLGISPEVASLVSENEADQTPFVLEGVRLGDSPVHGKGLFADQFFCMGDTIMPARISGKRTLAGRYTNHSSNPNALMVMRENDDVDLVAIRDIIKGEEILNDYYLAFVRTRPVLHGGSKVCQP